MILSILLLLVGFVLLIKGANFLVDGASSLAKRFNISNLVIGLTVVAFGTSAPELIVNIISSVGGRNDVAFGNIIGSNNFNILLVLGVSGLIYPIVVQRNTVQYEIPISFGAALLLYLLVNDTFYNKDATSALSRSDALVLLVFFGLFMIYISRMMRNPQEQQQQKEIKMRGKALSVGMVIMGLAMLVGGGKMVVDNAVEIAMHYKLSDKLIGLTILAIGTSLPELATSAVAAYKRNTDIAIGNVVGSNIFNLLLVAGITGVIHPIPFNTKLNFDFHVLGISSILLIVFMFTVHKRKLERWEATILFTGYIVYTIYLIASDVPSN